MMMNDDYRTTDMGVACALFCVGVILERLEPLDGNRMVFVFTADERIDDLVQNYWSGKLSVDAQKFFNTIRNIKSRVYSSQRSV